MALPSYSAVSSPFEYDGHIDLNDLCAKVRCWMDIPIRDPVKGEEVVLGQVHKCPECCACGRPWH